MQSYLSDRVLLYDTTEGRRTKVVTAGAAQGSVLGPDIWNIDYDEILGYQKTLALKNTLMTSCWSSL